MSLRRIAIVAAGLCAFSSYGQELKPFSELMAGDRTDPWQLQTIRGRPAAKFSLVGDENPVVSASSAASVASLFHPVEKKPAAGQILKWRWQIAEYVSASDLYNKAGDDFPARVYVMFDYDIRKLGFGARWKLRLARLIYGDWVPGAALCYVPIHGLPVDTIAPNPYSDRIQMIVVDEVVEALNTGNQDWKYFSRNVANDYELAFGEPAPPIIGIAIAIDTDDTGESATAFFGDITLEAAEL